MMDITLNVHPALACIAVLGFVAIRITRIEMRGWRRERLFNKTRDSRGRFKAPL